jgi:hypothetical protein
MHLPWLSPNLQTRRASAESSMSPLVPYRVKETHPDDRCHVVVFNHDRIQHFVDNFDRVTNFRPGADRIVVVDCSARPDVEVAKLETFAAHRGLTIGVDLLVWRRHNWGLAEGGRIDYFQYLADAGEKPAFVYQFQDHYLDDHSPASLWPVETGWGVKSDVIPDAFTLDLDACARVFADPSVDVVYADRLNIRTFDGGNRGQWVYPAGGNFGIRTSTLLYCFAPHRLERYATAFDGTYDWALFMEIEWGGVLVGQRCKWHDLVTESQFRTLDDLRALEKAAGRTLTFPGDGGRYPRLVRYYRRLLTRSRPEILALARLKMLIHPTLRASKRVLLGLMDKTRKSSKSPTDRTHEPDV